MDFSSVAVIEPDELLPQEALSNKAINMDELIDANKFLFNLTMSARCNETRMS